MAEHSWAAWRAQIRLAWALPVEVERCVIKSVGIIASVPLSDTSRTRFAFKKLSDHIFV